MKEYNSIKDKYTKIYLYILVSIVFMTNFGIVLEYGKEIFNYIMPFVWFSKDAGSCGGFRALYIFPALVNIAILSVIFYNIFKRFEIKYLKSLIGIMTILVLFNIVKVADEISIFTQHNYHFFELDIISNTFSFDSYFIDFPMFNKDTYEEIHR